MTLLYAGMSFSKKQSRLRSDEYCLVFSISLLILPTPEIGEHFSKISLFAPWK